MRARAEADVAEDRRARRREAVGLEPAALLIGNERNRRVHSDAIEEAEGEPGGNPELRPHDILHAAAGAVGALADEDERAMRVVAGDHRTEPQVGEPGGAFDAEPIVGERRRLVTIERVALER